MSDVKEPSALDESAQILKQNIVEGLTAFTSSIIKLLYTQNDNVLFSPINIYSALALVHLGADGKSREEIADLMKLPKENDRLQVAHKHLGETLNAITNTKDSEVYDENGWHKVKTTIINIVNGIFVEKNINLTPSYTTQAQLHYQSSISNVDFCNEASKATDMINEFISKSTNQRIPQLFEIPLSQDTRIVLAACLYFKANWDDQFSKQKTVEENFDTGSRNMNVMMMHNRKYVPYVNLSEVKLEAIGLKYKGGDVSMFFVLPYANQTLDNLISTLTADTLKQVINKSQSTYVDYKIPRMKFKWSQDINTRLEQLGIKEIFSNSANLNNMVVESGNLQVTKITHATEIEIDEEGTEASAVTAVRICKRSLEIHPDPINFHVGRPFLLFIYHHETKSIIFFAAVHNPNGA